MKQLLLTEHCIEHPPYIGWTPYCLKCSTPLRMTRKVFGWRCGWCHNEINWDLTHHENSLERYVRELRDQIKNFFQQRDLPALMKELADETQLRGMGFIVGARAGAGDSTHMMAWELMKNREVPVIILSHEIPEIHPDAIRVIKERDGPIIDLFAKENLAPPPDPE